MAAAQSTLDGRKILDEETAAEVSRVRRVLRISLADTVTILKSCEQRMMVVGHKRNFKDMVEEAIIAFCRNEREKRPPDNFLRRDRGDAAPPKTSTRIDTHKRALDPAIVQKILHLRSTGLKIQELATRFHLSFSSVARVVHENEKHALHVDSRRRHKPRRPRQNISFVIGGAA